MPEKISNFLQLGYNEWYERPLSDAPKQVIMSPSDIGSNVSYGALGASQLGALLNFTTTIIFTATDNNTAAWAEGVISFPDGTSTETISASNTGNITANTYVYYDKTQRGRLQTTTSPADAVGNGRTLLCAVEKVTDATMLCKVTPMFATGVVVSSITANQITANTITANEIASGTITTTELNFTPATSTNVIATINASAEGITIEADNIAISGSTTFSSGYDPADVRHASDVTKIDGGTVYANTIAAAQILGNTITASEIAANTITASEILGNTITATEIAASTITATEVSIAQLSAISAAMGDLTSGTITGGTIKTAGSGARVEMYPDVNTGLVVYDDQLTPAKVLEILVAGTDVGDVIIGDYASNKGAKWDKSAAIFAVKGTITVDSTSTIDGLVASTISGWQHGSDATKIDGGDIYTGSVTATQITVTNLAAINADLGSITAGNITIDSSGYIKGGQTAYNTGTGFFLGYDSTAYKLSIGDASTNSLTWDGATMTIRGTLNADDLSAGTVSGLTVQSASSGKRVVMDASDNSLAIYDSDGLCGKVEGIAGDVVLHPDSTHHVVIDDDAYTLRPESNTGVYLGTTSRRWNTIYGSTIDTDTIYVDEIYRQAGSGRIQFHHDIQIDGDIYFGSTNVEFKNLSHFGADVHVDYGNALHFPGSTAANTNYIQTEADQEFAFHTYGAGTDIIFYDNLDMNGYNIEGVNKIQRNSEDPTLKIEDKFYSTYTPDYNGQRCIYCGVITVEGMHEFDFSNEGDDAYVWYNSILFDDEISVLLTPKGEFCQFYYEIDKEHGNIKVYCDSESPVEFSFQLTGYRIDKHIWPVVMEEMDKPPAIYIDVDAYKENPSLTRWSHNERVFNHTKKMKKAYRRGEKWRDIKKKDCQNSPVTKALQLDKIKSMREYNDKKFELTKA